MKIIFFCNKFFSNNKILLLIYIVFTMLISFLSISIPYIMGKFIDILTLNNSIIFIYKYCTLFFIINIIKIIFEYIKSLLYIKIQMTTAFNINSYIINYIKKLPMSFFKNTDISYLNQRINSDSNSIVMFTINIFSDILTNSIILIFVIGILIKINHLISYILCALFISYIILYFSMRKILYKANYNFKEIQAKFFSKLHEQLYNVKFIKIHSVFSFFEERLYKSYLQLFKIAIKTNKISFGFKSFEGFITVSAQCILLLFSAVSVINGEITIGFFTVLSSYFTMLLNSLKYFIGVFQNYQENLVSYNRIQSILNVKQQINGSKVLNNISSIELKNINFKHDELQLFNNFNYIFEKGKIYCIVGGNGSGKSTLIDILLGLHVNEFDGQVLYNNININDINLYLLRKENIGVSEQEPLLISDTILNNIKLINKNFNEKKLDILMEKFNINNIKDKLVQENSNNLSGGEKQKISIIREILKNPDLIIFDEPTSALDKESKNEFNNLIKEIEDTKSKIIIIITHDKDLMKLTKNIIKINSGGNSYGMD